MYHLRVINFAGEVENFELGTTYKKIDVTKINKHSPYAQELVKLSNEEGSDPFVCKDNILIVSTNYSNLWLDSQNENYIIDSTGNTVEKIKPKLLELEDWAKILDNWEK